MSTAPNTTSAIGTLNSMEDRPASRLSELEAARKEISELRAKIKEQELPSQEISNLQA